ncbi:MULTISPECIES: ABC transporter ATP-binding protein [Paenibacillus]|uniref:Peptide/nickel transport system ATP-binding protein/oligopeptide transport system ATP-binding protein n=1 Tax=Paenibacillus pabuli TaxID=1472 RepID=A0A855XSI9_9BACL|nr:MULTISPECIES: ABC transporter ATP-binding protein [Paenibacillus]PWW36116.1 peptide/nickel transport system ATP-binding protein/oligopeptide transport system ATP-binding protein [Paenibacillus pabuli]PXW03195.1 peptide/nickel transport system ATP-binding protein/oligopeptide transport system ATP-binding protein [Paenibacillus taichungensis]
MTHAVRRVPQQPLLKIEGLKTYYPIKRGLLSRTVGNVKAVDDISLELYQGETLGLVGESGCGKSTIGRSIIRLENPTDGRIWFEGQDITTTAMSDLRGERTKMQMIFQDPYSSLNPRMRVQELLAEPMRVHGLAGGAELETRIDNLLDTVGIPRSYKQRFPHEFSGGQRQRIGIARALSMNPKLIVCDEPVSALDVSIQAQILNLLKELQRELGLTYLFIAHGLGAVKYISTRIAVMYLGKVVEIGTKERIFASPRHPYTQALLNAYPVPDPRKRGNERFVLQGDVPSPASPPSGCRFHTRCPFVQAKCKEEEPLLQGVEHAAACHYPLTIG